MASEILTPQAELRYKVEEGLRNCVNEHFYCVNCPYKELESQEFPLRCIYALLTDIQKLRYGYCEDLKFGEIICL